MNSSSFRSKCFNKKRTFYSQSAKMSIFSTSVPTVDLLQYMQLKRVGKKKSQRNKLGKSKNNFQLDSTFKKITKEISLNSVPQVNSGGETSERTQITSNWQKTSLSMNNSYLHLFSTYILISSSQPALSSS